MKKYALAAESNARTYFWSTNDGFDKWVFSEGLYFKSKRDTSLYPVNCWDYAKHCQELFSHRFHSVFRL